MSYSILQNRNRFLLMTIVLLMFSTSVNAGLITVNFDDGIAIDNTYIENGIKFVETGGFQFGMNELGLRDGNGDGSNELDSTGSAGCCHIDIFLTSGLTFDFVGLDIFNTGGIHELSASSGATFSAPSNGIYDFSSLSEWQNLSYIRLDDISGVNIERMVFNVESVPEPASITLLCLGLIGLFLKFGKEFPMKMER